MEASVSDSLEAITTCNTSLSDSYFTTTNPAQGEVIVLKVETAPPALIGHKVVDSRKTVHEGNSFYITTNFLNLEIAQGKVIVLKAKRVPPLLLFHNIDCSKTLHECNPFYIVEEMRQDAEFYTDYSFEQKIFNAVERLYLSNNPQNRQIADRLITIHRDAIDEDEHINPDSIPQFAEFFLEHSDVGLPKITLTPDGTLRVRWIHGTGKFTAIEFTGKPLAKVVAEIPRGTETARYFISETTDNLVSAVNAIGASFA